MICLIYKKAKKINYLKVFLVNSFKIIDLGTVIYHLKLGIIRNSITNTIFFFEKTSYSQKILDQFSM